MGTNNLHFENCRIILEDSDYIEDISFMGDSQIKSFHELRNFPRRVLHLCKNQWVQVVLTHGYYYDACLDFIIDGEFPIEEENQAELNQELLEDIKEAKAYIVQICLTYGLIYDEIKNPDYKKFLKEYLKIS